MALQISTVPIDINIYSLVGLEMKAIAYSAQLLGPKSGQIMVTCKRFAVTCWTIMRWSMVQIVVESKKELTSLIESTDEVDSNSEEMVCTDTREEKNCRATFDDAMEVNDYFDDG